MNATPQHVASRRYRIERYLTEGGMGAIYIGKKLGPGGFEKEVVLKQLLPEYTARPEFRDLFFREAKISATLDHANIVHTFDLVESEESLFIVMEYVRGVDLRSIIRRARLRRRELEPGAAIHVAMEVLAGLGYAHARRDAAGSSLGIIHRDVSPSNVLCSAEGEVKLSDFGIAKASTHSSVFYRVRGKVGYMSPEQARNEPIDHRSDLYSLAVCLYEALTFERLFVGDLSTPADVIYGQPIVPPSKKRKGLHPAIDAVLAKALSGKPNDRYQDASEFTEALRQVAHRYALLLSAPQLAEHLREILGPDPARWMSEEPAGASASDPGTQKLTGKTLEGKEAKSIGVVESTNLYVVSGRDVVSPRAVSSTKDSGKPKSGSGDPFISIDDDDDDEPTQARDVGGALLAASRPPPKAPTPPAGHRRHPTVPPPPPAAAFAPPPPPPPPPPAPPPRVDPVESEAFDSPFDAGYTPTPPPPMADDFAAPTPAPPAIAHYPLAQPAPFYTPVAPPPGHPPLGRAAYPNAPNYGQAAPWAPAPSVPAINLQPPDTIDFGAGAPAVIVKRTGPPGLLILILLFGAAAGGAKLAHVVTEKDMAALQAMSSSHDRKPAPASASEKTGETK